LALYKKYIEIYPELYFNFEDTNKINTVKIITYDDSVEWENKIKSGEKITSDFLNENGPKIPYALSESVKGNKYTYKFEGKWYIVKQEDWDRYINNEITKEQLNSIKLIEFDD
jgi:hypothetical protein